MLTRDARNSYERSPHAQGWQSTKDSLPCASPDSIMASPGSVEPTEIEAFALSSRLRSERRRPCDARLPDSNLTDQLTAALHCVSMAAEAPPPPPPSTRFSVLPSATRPAVSQQPQRSSVCRAGTGSASVDHSWCLEAMVGMVERTSSWSHDAGGVDLDLLDILESMQDDDGSNPSASVLPTLGVRSGHGMLPPTLEDERSVAWVL